MFGVFLHKSKSCLLTAYFYVNEYRWVEMAHTQGHCSWVHEFPIIVNLRYHLFVYDCFTGKFKFPMHIPEQHYEIKP